MEKYRRTQIFVWQLSQCDSIQYLRKYQQISIGNAFDMAERAANEMYFREKLW